MIWIALIVMTLTLCACRPEAQVGGTGNSPTESVGETEENVGQGAEVDENAEDTETGALEGAEGEESVENILIPEESEEGTEVTETEPAEDEEEAEVTLPAITTEDPALRAEADRIRKEQGESAYQEFCFKNDIKIYDQKLNVGGDFFDNRVRVYLKRSVSAQNKPAPDFSCVEYKIVKEEKLFYDRVPDENGQIFTITLSKNDKQGVLDAIKKLEQLDYVLVARIVPAGHGD